MEKVFDLLRLDGKVAVVTGGHAWLGFDAACALAEAGADIVITSRDKSTLGPVLKEISDTFGVRTMGVQMDQRNYDEVQAAMDVYSTQTVNGNALLEDTDTTALAKNIEDQAVESGFAEEVAQQISEMAMRTESYEDLQKMLEEELGAAAVYPGIKAFNVNN